MNETATASGIILPKTASSPLSINPKSLVVFAKPKVGKTSLLTGLSGCLILDLEDGTDYVSAVKLKAKSVADIKVIVDAIIAAGKPYKYIAVDTVSRLEDMVLPYAEDLYSRSPMGKSWYTDLKPKYSSLLNMPNGAGYPWLREAFTTVLNYIKRAAPHVILVGHLKDTVSDKAGAEFSSLDLDLTGKLKRITASGADAIGYIYRKGEQNIITFKSSDEVSCGARPEHLRNQTFVISEMTPIGYVTYWDKIFINLNK